MFAGGSLSGAFGPLLLIAGTMLLWVALPGYITYKILGKKKNFIIGAVAGIVAYLKFGNVIHF